MDLENPWQDSAQVQRLAQKVLDTEEEPVPDFFLPLLQNYLRISPYDTNFIVEFAQKGKPGQGGNGFGTITCMESQCWKDIILDADPDRSKGGKDDGFGSFFNYRSHCQHPRHIEGRNERLEKEGVTIPSSPPAEEPSSPSQSDHPDSFSSSSSFPALQASSSSAPLATRDANIPDTKPRVGEPISSQAKGKGKAKEVAKGVMADPIYISSDDDEPPRKILPKKRLILDSDDEDSDIEVLEGDRVPSDMRRITNIAAPFELSDDEDDSGPSTIRNSTLAPLAGLSAKAVEDNRKKAAANRLNQSAAWARLLKAPSSPVRSLSQKSVKDQPPLSPVPAVNAIAGPSTVKSESGLVQHHLPDTWWANEIAHAKNWENIRIGLARTETPDFTRPRLEHFVRSGQRVAPLVIIEAEYKQLVQIASRFNNNWETRKRIFVDRLRQLARWKRSPYMYEVPGYDYLLLAGLDLKHLWERLLPYRSPAQISRGQVGPCETPGAVSETPHVSFNERLGTLAESLRQGIESFGSQIGAFGNQFGASGMPGGLSDMGMRDFNSEDNPYGYEHDRPLTEDGLQDLFKTALDDFHEDNDVEAALEGLGLTRLEDKIDGMNVQLMPHQVLGVHWMVQREKKSSNQGGILGDMMGLGKTVQAIATMVKHASTDRKIKTTLIVLPLPLIQQWKAEIESKSDLTVYVYHGGQRTKSTNQLKSYDCVLTTYSIVANEAADLIEKSKRKKKKKKDDDFVVDDEEEEERAKKKGPLFKVAWYRIILDEAAVIRNKSTKASKAVQELVGDIRWCLTGTLIYNSLTDIYPYLRFIGIIDWEDFRIRVHSISKRKPRLACRRAQALLRRVMLRRTKDSELNGRKILQLPPKTIDMVEMDFTEEERAIYAAIETAARVKVNRWYKAGTLLKQYHVVLVMLTRLRQFCCHPWLLRASDEYQSANVVELDEGEEDAGGSSAPQKELTDLEELERATKERGQEWVDKVKKKLEDRYQNMIQEKEGDEDDYSCAVCFEPFTEERITSCQHSFCATCIDGILAAAPRDDVVADENVRQSRPCPLCRNEVTRSQLYRAKVFFDPKELEDEEDVKPFPLFVKRSGSSDEEDVKPTDLKGKGKAKAEPDDETAEIALENVDIEDVLPSTKMNKIAQLLDVWTDVDPTQKTLIFCSFVEMLELMSVFLKKRDIKHVMYTGKMSMEERDNVIKQFQKSGDKTPKVMLISLKCGGVGLNLTAANNVIGLDLAWSPASEAQAIDRAHRIGQTKSVTVKRLIIRDSVEQRILALQEKKQMLADGAMGEGNGGRLGRLTAGELVALFGNDNAHED